MTSFSWLADTHLDCVGDYVDVIKFFENVHRERTEFIIHTGDIATSKELIYSLSALEKIAEKPIYFVLGNHDFYGSRVDDVRKSMHELMNVSTRLKYLSELSYVPVSPTTALVGHDGWYDCRANNPKSSRLVMSDWVKIGDYTREGATSDASMYSSGGVPQHAVITKVSQTLADAATQHVAAGIKAAARYHKKIVVVTHVPPFVEGTNGDAEHTPFYTNIGMGLMLRRAADSFQNISFDVFSGHSHVSRDVKVARNMNLHTREATYGLPASTQIILG